jgi:hypothetical protein
MMSQTPNSSTSWRFRRSSLIRSIGGALSSSWAMTGLRKTRTSDSLWYRRRSDNCSDRWHSSPGLPVQACRLFEISYPNMMTARFTRLVPLALIATVPVLFGVQTSAPREIVLNHVSLIDMTGRPIQRDMAALLRGDRIAAIERAAGFNVPGARVFDLTGKFLIPGLVDMHHHLDTGAAMPGPPIPGQERARDVRANLMEMLGWGFTTVFSTSHMNVDLREFAELRRAAIDDTALPRYFGVGRAISVASGHASQPRLASYLPASADEARLNVRELHAIGVDAIKLIYADQAHTGRPPLPMMQPEVMRAIIDEAHRLSLKAYVHAPALRPAKEVLRAGADGLVHSVTDAPLDDEFIALMKKNRATYTSTLSLYTAFSDIAGWTRRLAAMDTGAVSRKISTRSSCRQNGRRPTTPSSVRFRRTTFGMQRPMCDAPSMQEFPFWQARTPACQECFLAYRARWNWFFS